MLRKHRTCPRSAQMQVQPGHVPLPTDISCGVRHRSGWRSLRKENPGRCARDYQEWSQALGRRRETQGRRHAPSFAKTHAAGQLNKTVIAIQWRLTREVQCHPLTSMRGLVHPSSLGAENWVRVNDREQLGLGKEPQEPGRLGSRLFSGRVRTEANGGHYGKRPMSKGPFSF